MNERLRWAGAVVLVCAPALDLVAGEPEVAPAEAAAAKDKSAVVEHHRVTLGMTIPNGVGAGTGGGAVGGLGSIPYATAGYETRMAGPAWFLVALRGGIDGDAIDDTQQYGSWYAGATVGVRVEAPVHEYVELGGYGRFGGSLSSYGGPGYVQDSWQLGAEIGAGMHFRPTRLFGVRLCIDVLDWGYGEASDGAQLSAQVYAHLKASPSLELTFSF
jgi:hypothetical protein